MTKSEEGTMDQSKYLIVGSSHAGLSAIESIRIQDMEGSIILLNQEDCLPYSPTILPYVVSGKADASKVSLMNQEDLDGYRITFKRGAKAVKADPSSHTVTLQSGETIGYEKLLLATGAEPTLPPIPGLQNARFHVLRTLDDARQLRHAAQTARSAIVLGAGLIGMHAAENLAKAGLRVTIVEALPQVLPAYFDGQAAGLIQKIFAEQGVTIFAGSAVTRVASSSGACALSLESGVDLSADLLVVATGVKPRVSYVSNSEIEVGHGILVNETMHTSAKDVWAAGDVAQAPNFFEPSKVVQGTLPTAVEQGRTAGLDMVGDPALKPYPGGIPMNAYRFFGHRSFSIGLMGATEPCEGIQVDLMFLPASQHYQKLVYQNNRLVGVSCINSSLDPGIMYQLIKRQVDLTEVKKDFSTAPRDMGRLLMSRTWC
jgi:phenylglyoxylate dehydrogenase epsilon subunit